MKARVLNTGKDIEVDGIGSCCIDADLVIFERIDTMVATIKCQECKREVDYTTIYEREVKWKAAGRPVLSVNKLKKFVADHNNANTELPLQELLSR